MSWIRDEELKLTWYERLAVNVIRQGVIPQHIAIIMGKLKFTSRLVTFQAEFPI